MLFKLSVASLSLLVALATAMPRYSEWERDYYWNSLFTAKNAAAHVQAEVDQSACTTVTQKEPDGSEYRVRICTADSGGTPTCARRLTVCIQSYIRAMELRAV